MAANGSELTAKQERAALLVWADDLTDVQIAETLKIGERTLNNWKKLPAFQARVAEHRDEFRERVLSEGYADRAQRVHLLNEMAEAAVDHLRANRYEREDVLINRKGEVVTNVVYDRERVSAVRGMLDDIAKELGERRHVSEVNGTLTLAQLIADYAEPPDGPR
jgi:hypothetical protein